MAAYASRNIAKEKKGESLIFFLWTNNNVKYPILLLVQGAAKQSCLELVAIEGHWYDLSQTKESRLNTGSQ